MIRSVILMLGPLGIGLVLAISSLTTYRLLSEFGQAMDPGTDYTVNVPSIYSLGELGLLQFGVALAFAATFQRERTPFVIGALGGAAFFLGIACFFLGFGNWVLLSAFRSLAAAATIDAEDFLGRIAGAKMPILIGWSCALFGATLISAASLRHLRGEASETMKITPGFWIALVSCVIFLVAIAYGGSSFRALVGVLRKPPPYGPLAMANGTAGMLLSRFMAIVGIASSAAVCLLMAAATRPNPNKGEKKILRSI